jgi:TP901 family phage tail tape measure protein
VAKPVILRFLADTSQFIGGVSKVKAETAALSGPLATASAGLRNFGATAMKTGGMLSRRLTLPIVALAGVSAKLATDFEDSMSKIEGLVGVSGTQVKAWGDEVLALSRKLPQSPKELADALFFVTSAGFRGKEAMQVLEASARAAAAGLGETKVVADAVTSAVNAYGLKNLSAKAATDVLVAAVREGKMPAEDLAGALGRVIAPSQALGVSFDQVGASIASMTRLGLSADESATALRAVLMGVLKPSQQATEAFQSMGYSGDELRKVIAEKGLLAGLQSLRAKAGDNTAALGKLFPNVRALNGFLIMTGASAGATSQIFDNLRASTGSADKAFGVASKTAKFQFNAALSSLQATGIQIGSIVLPILVSLARGVASLADKFGSMSPVIQKVVVIAALLVAAIGPIVWIVGAISAALGFLLSPVGLVILAIVGLVAVFVMLYKKNEKFREFVTKAWNTIKEKALEFAEGVREAFQRAIGWVRSHSDQIRGRLEQLGRSFSGVVEAVRAAWDAIFAIGAFLVKVIEYVIVKPILDLWTRFGDQLLDKFRIAWNAIVQIFDGIVQALRGVFEIFAGIFTLDWSKTWEGVKHVFGGVWDAILGIAKMFINAVSSVIGLGMAAISLAWGYVWGGLKSVVSAAWDGIIWAAKRGWNIFAGFWNRVLDALTAPARLLGDHVPGMGWLSTLARVRIPTFDLGGGNSDRNYDLTPRSGAFANGGIIDRPMRALIGEAGAEAVIPLTRPRRAAEIMRQAGLAPTGTDGAGGITIQNMTVTALDPRRAARIAAEEWAWAAKTGGY